MNWHNCRHRGNKLRDMQNCNCEMADTGVYHCLKKNKQCVKELPTTRTRERFREAGVLICDECPHAES